MEVLPLKEIVSEALALPEAERTLYLEQACAGDDNLRSELASLLELEGEAAGFFADPPLRQVNVASPLEEGYRLDAYRILRLLGSGGMGEVYLAERADGAFEQQVAIKVIRAVGGLGELLERFLSERQLLADLQHPNIAKLLDGGTTGDGRPYLVMDYVDGEPIDAYCERGDLSVESRLRLFLEVCAAVEHAHRHLVVHRDLKPANILITAGGEPKLLDFGVAKDLGGAGKTPETRLLVPVTPEYASPEQLTGGSVTTASDVYALGVVLYELLAGQSPFDGEDPLAGRSRSAPPDRPSTRAGRVGGRRARHLRRRLTGDLDHVVLRALAPDPTDRYPSVEQLARDIDRHLRGLALETRDGVLYRYRKLIRRSWKGLAMMAVVLGLGGVWLDEAFERQQLERESRRTAELSSALGEYLGVLFQQADPGTSGERSRALERMLDQGAAMLASGAFSDQPSMRAELLSAIGQVYRRQNRLDKAEPLLRESLALRRQYLPPDGEELAVTCNNLANILRDLGYYEDARSLLLEARGILEQIRKGDHLQTATMLNNLAGVEKDLGRFEEAIRHYTEALAMKRRLALESASIAMAIKNLGTAQRAADRLDDAKTTLLQARDELSRSEQSKPSVQAGLDHHLGAIRRQQGDLVAARQLLDRAYAIRVGLYGQGHKKSAETFLEQALLNQAEGKIELAEEQLFWVVDIRRERLGTEHPLTAAATVHLARLLAERDKSEADALATVALEAFSVRLPTGHWRISDAEELLVELRRAPGQDAASAPDPS